MRSLKQIIALLLAVVIVTSTSAQESGQKTLPSSHLEPFTSIRVDADIELTLVKIEEVKGNPRISYKLGDNDPEKFKFVVKPSGELNISQNPKTKSVEKITATIYYNTIEALRISRAKVTIDGIFDEEIADLTLNNGAELIGEVDCADLDIEVGLNSRLNINGKSRYVTLRATSGAKVELRQVDITSARIEASQGAVVALNAGDRLEVNAATKSVVKYWGNPQIIRIRRSLLGGEIIQQER